MQDSERKGKMVDQTPYIGSKISLISKLNIRYEGILYTVDTKESTISLAKVRSFGTEGRPAANPVAARNDFYEYIIFKAYDIKELVVCETPKAATPLDAALPCDPAIVSASDRTVPVSSQPSATPTLHSQFASLPDRNSPPSGRPSFGNNGRGGYGRMNDVFGNGRQRGGRTSAYPPKSSGAQPRGNFSFGMSRPNPKQEQLKFDKDYDFEHANEIFKEEINKLVESKQANGDSQAATESMVSVEEKNTGEDVKEKEEEEKANEQLFYDKKSSFFDRISCQDIETTKRPNERADWKKERVTNTETFGEETVRTMNFLRRGGYKRGRGMNHAGGRGRGYRGAPRYYTARV